MKRFYIFAGDKTSSDGIPIASQDHSTWHGRYYIMLNDKVYCPACKKTGTVVGQGPRLDDNWMGKRPALNDDICVCDCRPAPKLIAYQDNDWQMMTAEEVAAQGYGSMKQATAENSDEFLEQYFEFVDDSGSPVNLVYRVETFEGITHEGMLENDGRTIKVPYSRNKDMRMISWTKAV
jgi:uncharacterized Zn-binding protein involved in type VI secretion